MNDEATHQADMGAPQHDGSDGVNAQISREMVRLYKELFGRGPTKARTTISRDLVVCTLEDSQTPAERSLVRLGEQQRLRDTRTFFQHASEGEFRNVIESRTGRKVRAFVSGMDVNEDVSAEVFYLHPEGS
jgi:uncharacterized protein YbcI